MARLTKSDRRRAALKGWRNRKNNPSKRKARKRIATALKKFVRGSTKGNPGKGRKVKGGRAVRLKNFTGTVTRLAGGQVRIEGRGRR